ncbi:hypothetical protein AC481_02540 [miscellaneous Crenarchaeota group archaeon SMTZ-80]|nr:MAG: hypothetical protein AC481_02540 [miscellaneous Crenarchaeota group archaeon SMTZ-80]
MSSIERRKLFRDPSVQKVIESILHKSSMEIIPTFDPKKGFYYKEFEDIFQDIDKSEMMLRKMSDSGILEKKFYDTTVICPKCKSSQISLRYRCPKCNSAKIDCKSLLEHVKCGAIDSIEKFRKNGELECFQCKVIMSENDPDIKNIGSWFLCASCDFRFDEPLTIQRCMNCESEFLTKDAKMISLFSYSMNEGIKNEYERELALLLLLKPELDKLKSKIEMMAVLKGKSGSSYEFDVVAWRKGKKKPTVIDVVMNSEPIGTNPVTSMFAKIYDIEPSRSILAAIPSLQEEGHKLAKLYKIEIIEAGNMEEAVSKLIDAIKD